jgi:hypothetical protein
MGSALNDSMGETLEERRAAKRDGADDPDPRDEDAGQLAARSALRRSQVVAGGGHGALNSLQTKRGASPQPPPNLAAPPLRTLGAEKGNMETRRRGTETG